MKKLMIICLIGFLAASAQAGIVDLTNVVDGGPAPSSLDLDDVENASPQIFAEQQDVLLGASLAVDVAGPGTYQNGGTCSDVGTIPAGVTVNSYIVHFDPLGTGVLGSVSGCSVELDGLILGLIYQSGEGMAPDNLAASDGVVGDSSTYWIDDARGMDLCWLDQDDPIVLSADRLTLDFAVYATAIDEMRIIELAGNSIGKTRESGPDEIGICLYDTTVYTFAIAYAGEAALIVDTVPAEFEITNVVASAGSASYESANKKDNDKSATIINWDVPAGMSTLTVTIQTRQSTGKGHEKHGPAIIYKPTSCGSLALNDGATAYEVDEFGEPVLDAFGEMIVIAGPSDPLEVEAVCGTKPCAPENLTVTLTASDTLSLDWDDVCVGGDAVVYNVYRGGSLIAEDVAVSEYVDSGLSSGYYCYEVEAEYSEGPYIGNQGGKSEQECETVP